MWSERILAHAFRDVSSQLVHSQVTRPGWAGVCRWSAVYKEKQLVRSHMAPQRGVHQGVSQRRNVWDVRK